MPTSKQPSEEGRQGKNHSDELQPRESQSRDCVVPARAQEERPGGGVWGGGPNGQTRDSGAGGRPTTILFPKALLRPLIPKPTTSDALPAEMLRFTTARAQRETRDSGEEAPTRAAQSARPLPAPAPS